MIPPIPGYITAVVLLTDLVIVASVWGLVSAAAGRAAVAPAQRRGIRFGTALFLLVWLGAALLLAPAPVSLAGRDPFYLTPLLPLFATIPPGVAGLALWLSPPLRRAIAEIPLSALVGVQFYRVVGALFVILLAQGLLPAHFAVPAGWGDVAVGLAAPLIALAVARGFRGAYPAAILWNLVGLFDLVVAVGMGTGLLAPILTPELGRVPPAGPMGVFPLVLVPTFAVPVSVLLHLLALARATREVRLRPTLIAGTAR